MPKTSEYFCIQNNYYFCKQCKNILAKNSALKASLNLEDSYIKTQLQKKINFNTGISISKKNMNLDMLELQRLSILKHRSLKYAFEGISFSNIRDLAKFIENKYDIKRATTEWRLRNGYPLNELIIKKKRPFQVKKIRYTINNLQFTTLKSICNHYSLNYSSLVNHLYKNKNLEETVNYLLCKK